MERSYPCLLDAGLGVLLERGHGIGLLLLELVAFTISQQKQMSRSCPRICAGCLRNQENEPGGVVACRSVATSSEESEIVRSKEIGGLARTKLCFRQRMEWNECATSCLPLKVGRWLHVKATTKRDDGLAMANGLLLGHWNQPWSPPIVEKIERR